MLKALSTSTGQQDSTCLKIAHVVRLRMHRMRALIAASFLVAATAVVTEVTRTDVFTSGKEGYACYRIPAMVRTTNGTTLLFAEGRKFSCDDHGYVDLVVKVSGDGGTSWGALQVVHGESSTDKNVTIGNAAPVVLASGRILLPFCRNNQQVGVLFSDDSGGSWSLLVNLSLPPDWTWVATGPPGSLELSNGRILVPGNHNDPKSGAASHVFISDDGGHSWTISGDVPKGNEDQASALTWISATVRWRENDAGLFGTT
jgi:sialidase-1